MSLRLGEGGLQPAVTAAAEATATAEVAASEQTQEAIHALASALTKYPTPAETVTKEAYIAGHYPHAQENPPPASAEVPVGLAGAEIFVSSLESIVETSHRDRQRRGWFHPSVASRSELCRTLAANADAEARFNKRLKHTRYWILALAAVAATVLAISCLIPDQKAQASTPTATLTAPANQTAPASHPTGIK